MVVLIRLKEDTQRIGCSKALGPRILSIPFGVLVLGVLKAVRSDRREADKIYCVICCCSTKLRR